MREDHERLHKGDARERHAGNTQEVEKAKSCLNLGTLIWYRDRHYDVEKKKTTKSKFESFNQVYLMYTFFTL